MQSISFFLFQNKSLSFFWLIARVYLGFLWIQAGYEKFQNPAWIGDKSGTALTGFIKGALAKTAGDHPDVTSWYAWFLQHAVTPHVDIWSQAITYGEIAVGVGLILGAFTFISAFFGFFMNLNFLLAGSVSTNPIMLVIALLIMLARKSAGYLGVDRFIFPSYRY